MQTDSRRRDREYMTSRVSLGVALGWSAARHACLACEPLPARLTTLTSRGGEGSEHAEVSADRPRRSGGMEGRKVCAIALEGKAMEWRGAADQRQAERSSCCTKGMEREEEGRRRRAGTLLAAKHMEPHERHCERTYTAVLCCNGQPPLLCSFCAPLTVRHSVMRACERTPQLAGIMMRVSCLVHTFLWRRVGEWRTLARPHGLGRLMHVAPVIYSGRPSASPAFAGSIRLRNPPPTLTQLSLSLSLSRMS